MQNQPNQTMDNSVICMTYFQNYPDRKFVSCMTSRTELSILKILSKKIICKYYIKQYSMPYLYKTLQQYL